MILIDRLIRFIYKDIFLPTKCHASNKDIVCPKQSCECRIFCKKIPRGKPVPVFVYGRDKKVFKYTQR